MEETATKFETESCGRCCGTGHHSQCAGFGTRCFACGGSGRRDTKRGAAARAFLAALRSKPASAVVVGETVRVPSRIDRGPVWGKVTAVRANTYGNVVIETAPGGFCLCASDLVRIAQTPEAKAEQFAAAVAYQATLTKAGTVRINARKGA